MPRSVPSPAGVALSVALLLLCSSGSRGRAEEQPAAITVEHTAEGAREAGLLDALGSAFGRRTGAEVRWVPRAPASSGTGSQADVTLLAARRSEVPEADAGHVVWSERLLVVGPPEDRASYGEINYLADMRGRGLLGGRYPLREASAKVLFQNLRPAGSRFFSRGDGSLVHRVERALWGERAPEADPRWYVETQADMSTTLQQAGKAVAEARPYVLTDETTFLRHRADLKLHVVLGLDPALEIAVTAAPTDEDAGESSTATRFVRWLRTDAAKAIIRDFAVSEVCPFRPSGQPATWTLRGRLDPQPEPEEDEDAE